MAPLITKYKHYRIFSTTKCTYMYNFFTEYAIAFFRASSENEKLILMFNYSTIDKYTLSSVQFSRSVVSKICEPMDCSTPHFPVHHQHPELTQTHGHRVGDTIQPCLPLSSPSPPSLNLSQHQGLFQWVSTSHQVAKVLEFQLQHQSYQWTPRSDLL